MTMRTVLRALSVRLDPEQTSAAFAASSLMLRYPDESLMESLDPLTTLSGQLPGNFGKPFRDMCAYLSDHSLLDSQALYVATFDLKRRCCLYLSYYLNGDTRRRGMALWRFQDAYRSAGQQVTQGELPDYLPALLEFAATGGLQPATQLMNEHRAGILVLLEALEEMASPYAGIVRAVDSLLPPRADRVISDAERLVYEGPPSELVGIDDVEAFEPYATQISCESCATTEAFGAVATDPADLERP
jgi:nitrate reductase delta subunit